MARSKNLKKILTGLASPNCLSCFALLNYLYGCSVLQSSSDKKNQLRLFDRQNNFLFLSKCTTGVQFVCCLHYCVGVCECMCTCVCLPTCRLVLEREREEKKNKKKTEVDVISQHWGYPNKQRANAQSLDWSALQLLTLCPPYYNTLDNKNNTLEYSKYTKPIH